MTRIDQVAAQLRVLAEAWAAGSEELSEFALECAVLEDEVDEIGGVRSEELIDQLQQSRSAGLGAASALQDAAQISASYIERLVGSPVGPARADRFALPTVGCSSGKAASDAGADLGEAVREIIDLGARIAAAASNDAAWRTALEAQRKQGSNVSFEIDAQELLARRSALLRALEATRPGYGAHEKALQCDGAANTVKLVRAQTKFLPREWIIGSNDAGEVLAFQQTPNSNILGECSAPDQDGNSELIFDLPQTALHELVHRCEYTRPLLDELTEAFFEIQTDGEAWIAVSGSDGSTHYHYKEDSWFDAYVGRGYSRFDGSLWGGGEVLSMGVEALFYGDSVDLTDEHLLFTLGVLGGR